MSVFASSDQAKTNKFCADLRGTLSWYLDVRSKTLDLEGEHRVRAIGQHIASSYGVIPTALSLESPLVINPMPFVAKTYLSQDRKYLQPIVELYEFINCHMQGLVSQVILLSSLATLDYSRGWSDLDAFMVIKDSTVRDGKKLHQLRALCFQVWRFFQKITPLQHHGFIIVSESDLATFDNSIMPLPAFKGSISLLDRTSAGESLNLKFNLQPSTLGSYLSLKQRADSLREALHKGELRHHPYKGHYLKLNYENAENSMYQLFCMLGYVMTVPAYLLEGLGQSCYKGDSFELARRYFSDSAWIIVDKASEIRRLWQEREYGTYKLNAIPNWVRQTLGPHFIQESLALIDEALQHLKSRS